MANATAAASKTRKPPKVFSVTGGAKGIQAEISNYAMSRLLEASAALEVLSLAGHFPKARAASLALDDFLKDPTAKADDKQPELVK